MLRFASSRLWDSTTKSSEGGASLKARLHDPGMIRALGGSGHLAFKDRQAWGKPVEFDRLLRIAPAFDHHRHAVFFDRHQPFIQKPKPKRDGIAPLIEFPVRRELRPAVFPIRRERVR